MTTNNKPVQETRKHSVRFFTHTRDGYVFCETCKQEVRAGINEVHSCYDAKALYEAEIAALKAKLERAEAACAEKDEALDGAMGCLDGVDAEMMERKMPPEWEDVEDYLQHVYRRVCDALSPTCGQHLLEKLHIAEQALEELSQLGGGRSEGNFIAQRALATYRAATNAK